MASNSVSSIQKSFNYDVFLSFRGEDTRRNFVDHLYHALQQKSIDTYKDDEKIEKGKRISDQLVKSIEDSRFHIIVFSKNYASSSWCLDELVKIMECQKTTEQTAFPVFYDVEPTEVRNQSGAVGEAFAKHVDKEAAGRWRDALKEAAGLAGWELKNTVDGHEAKFIQQIVQVISPKLHFINFIVNGKVVGSSLESICGLQHLKELRVEGSIQKVPKDMWRLECLEKLSLCMKEIKRLPDSICMLRHLKSLELTSCWRLEQLPENICRLGCLEELHLTDCTSLRDIPNNICKLKCLKRLHLSSCHKIEKLPKELGCLQCLVELRLTDCGSLRDIPNSICRMKCLKRLHLSSCHKVENLPKELGCLERLVELHLTDCRSLRGIPNSICRIKCLTSLNISFCHKVEKLPEELGCVECLKVLNIDNAGISFLPHTIFRLKGMCIVGSRRCLESYGFRTLKEITRNTVGYYV